MPYLFNVYLTIQILGFATGSVLLLVLLGYLRKARRLGGWTGYGPATVLLGLAWNLGVLFVHVSMLVDGTELAPVHYFAGACAHSAQAWLPTAFWLDQGEIRWTSAWRARARHWFSLVSMTIAGVLTVGYFTTAGLPVFRSWTSLLWELTAWNLVLHAATGSVIFHGGPRREDRDHTCARIVTVLGLVLAVGLWVRAQLAVPLEWRLTVRMIADQSTIAGTIVVFGVLTQFRFADAFVKRSLTILTAEVVAVAATLMVFEPMRSGIRLSVAYNKAGVSIAYTILLGALLLSFPTLERLISKAADRFLFQRPNYRNLLADFAREIAPLSSESKVVDVVERIARTALNIDSARIVPFTQRDAFGRGLDVSSDTVIQLRSDHPARRLLVGLDTEAVVPIRVSGDLDGLLTLSAGERSRKLFSDEIAFLTTIAERTARKIEALRFDEELRTRQMQEAQLHRLLMEAEINALRAQVNPHFLFNTLNTIADLIAVEPEKAELMTERLAEVFRYCLTQTGRTVIPLGEEFDFIRTYLEIEQVRFGDRLRVSLDLDRSVADHPIPSLLLQPLVENAVKHGLAPKPGPGGLRVLAEDAGTSIRIIVEDNGVGRPSKADFLCRNGDGKPARNGRRESGGVGLNNVVERLRAFYGDAAELVVETAPGRGTRVEVTIPKRDEGLRNEG